MKTISLIPGEKVHGLPLEQIPVRAEDVGIPLKRLLGFVMRGELDDPIGFRIGKQAVVYNDWRLRALQAREGVPVFPEPSALTLITIERETYEDNE